MTINSSNTMAIKRSGPLGATAVELAVEGCVLIAVSSVYKPPAGSPPNSGRADRRVGDVLLTRALAWYADTVLLCGKWNMRAAAHRNRRTADPARPEAARPNSAS
jgi:hypothetical protein